MWLTRPWLNHNLPKYAQVKSQPALLCFILSGLKPDDFTRREKSAASRHHQFAQ